MVARAYHQWCVKGILKMVGFPVGHGNRVHFQRSYSVNEDKEWIKTSRSVAINELSIY